jgi:hypothetical protein
MKRRLSNDIARVRKRKEQVLRTIKVPEDALPGSLSMSRLRCGKSSCHCSEDAGHENWTLTYMVEGKKRVKHIPQDLVEDVRQKLEQGKSFKEGINEILLANAELLILLQKKKRRT